MNHVNRSMHFDSVSSSSSENVGHKFLVPENDAFASETRKKTSEEDIHPSGLEGIRMGLRNLSFSLTER